MPANMLAVDFWMPPTRFGAVESRARFFDAALTRIRALPGVRGAAFVADFRSAAPPTRKLSHSRPAGPCAEPLVQRRLQHRQRGLLSDDGHSHSRGPRLPGRRWSTAPGVIVVNQTAAKRFWPDRSALGQQIDLPITRQKRQRLTVVGVADNVRHAGLAVPPRPEIFVNSMQTDLNWSSVVLAVRTSSNPAALADAVKAALREVDPAVPVAGVNTVDDVIARSMAEPKLYTLLMDAFAIAAVVLAAVGLYGLIAFSVAQRSHEMGIRAALGASRSEIVRLVLGEGVGLAAVGTAIGVAAGLAATRALVGLMAGIQPNDPATFAVVATVSNT